MKTEEIPALPTREQELKYLGFLQKSLLSDPWITTHPKKYMANPKRLRYKQTVSFKKEYIKTFFKNALLIAGLTAPINI